MREAFIERLLVLSGYRVTPRPRNGIILPGEYHYCPLCGSGFLHPVVVAESDTLRHDYCMMVVQSSTQAIVDALQGAQT